MGYRPDYRITDLIHRETARIERARGFLEGATLSARWLQQQQRDAFVREAHHTTHIEGTQLTLHQAECALNGEPVQGANLEDVKEVVNYRAAFELVSDNPEVSEALIRELHRCLVQDVRGGAAAPGEYRRVQNYVVNSATGETIYTPPPAFEVPRMMAELVEWIRRPSDIHPVLVAGIAQFQLVHVHPFLDGNGRTARLLSTLCLYRAGYDFKRLFTISEYYDRDRPAYYAALQSVRENGLDLTEWLEYFVVALTSQLDEVQIRARRAIDIAAVADEHGLSARQQGILELAALRPSIVLNDLLNAYPAVARRTLQRDLNQLTSKGLLKSEGATRSSTYRLP